jgi:type IV pilus assembly protein PilW
MKLKHAQGGEETGFSLIELMIALSLGLVLILGVTTLSLSTSNRFKDIDQNSKQFEGARFSMDRISQDLQHAGYFGELFEISAPTVLPDPCETGFPDVFTTLAGGISLPIQGYDDPQDSPLACLPDADHLSGTDVLVIRRAETVTATLDQLSDDGTIYLQSSGENYVLGACLFQACDGLKGSTSVTGTSAQVFSLLKKDNITVADLRRYRLHVYFIRPWTELDAEGTPDDTPSLVRLVLASDGNGNLQLVQEQLVDGIENFQVQYGLDDGIGSDGNPAGVAGDGAPERYVEAPEDLTQWSNVVTVRVNLLARNPESSAGYSDTKSYELGEGPITPEGRFRRHVFSSVLRLINIGARRET